MFEAGAGRTQIDVRSVWFLLLYASEFLDSLTSDETDQLLSGERDDDLNDALAEVLAERLQKRLRSQLLPGYRSRSESLTRVRGRIEHLRTESRRLTESGHIQCRFEEQTVDRPRYRYMLMTLRHAAVTARSERTRKLCMSTAHLLERSGVKPTDPTRTTIRREQFGHFDREDRKLVQLCELIRDCSSPEHSRGINELPLLLRNEARLRKLFEKAVLGFFKTHLGAKGWSVGSEQRSWPMEGDPAALFLMPNLNADVVLRKDGVQVVVECKFAPIFKIHHTKTILDPAYTRQVYAYASIFGRGFPGETRALLLGAQVAGSEGSDFDLRIDGFPLRVRQIDLTMQPSAIREALGQAVDERHAFPQ